MGPRGAELPDVYIKTPELLIVAEGKRTERGPTTKTTYMPVRWQLLRHLDGLWDRRAPGQAAVGLYIVEGAEPDPLRPTPRWRKALERGISPEVLEQSLPHRTTEQREQIAAAVLGGLTWQALCQATGLRFPPVPDAATPPPAW